MDGVFTGPGPTGHQPDRLSGGPARPITALIIDDNGRFRAALAGLLGRAGICVREAADGAAGITAARDATPDVVVTDIYMPGTGGLPTIAELRRAWPGLKIIAMSGADAPAIDLGRRSTALGADWFLPKPFDADELLDLIGRLVEPGASR
jgi:DNA-binding response OmpR family regulator